MSESQILDETDKLISDFVGTDDDIATGKACGNCRHELHNDVKVCNAFTKVRGQWDSCDCTESTVGFKINVKVRVNDQIISQDSKDSKPTEPIKPNKFIPLSELNKK